MTQTFHELLLSELHMVVCQPGDPSRLSDRLLCEAVTVNENLQSLGFILKPDALLQLAVSPSLHTFYEDVKALVPEVKAQPMYPGFPLQVMAMSEAEMKWNQFVHTFSILCVEWLTGEKVSKGWHPDNRVLIRDQEDTTLLDARVLELVAEADAPALALSTLLARRERLTSPELALAVEAASLCEASRMEDMTVRFKENLDLLFPLLMELEDRTLALRILRVICSHSGDVLRCTAGYLSHRRYHLRTSEKKLLVKLLESYPVWNLRQNLVQSNALRERNLLILRHLDYNQYSRSPEHREAVRALRNRELLSWSGIGEAMLKDGNPQALSHFAQRPGYMVRMLIRLLSLGYSKEAILNALLPKSGAISTHLLLQTIRALAGRGEALEEQREKELQDCRLQHQARFCYYETWRIEVICAWEKRNCIDQYRRAFNDLLPDGGQRQQNSCICSARLERQKARQEKILRKEEAIAKVREMLQQEQERIDQISNELNAFRDTTAFVHLPNMRAIAGYGMLEVQLSREQADFDAKWQELLNPMLEEIYADYDEALWQIDSREQEELARLEAFYRSTPDPYAEEREALTRKHEQELAKLERKHRKLREDAQYLQKNRDRILAEALADIEEKYRRIQRTLPFNDEAVAILKALLREHFRQAATPLKGKKVFCSMDAFDLAHSTLETDKRSDDGGYIRSGISWKIPDNARYVRFFIYWNDPSRVIIDLHAGGVTQSGQNFHVGWNTYFHGPGVLHSGDVLHSDASQFVDIDLNAPLKEVYTNLHLWAGKQSFRQVETCYVGMMAVDQIGQEVKLYSPKNCFFTHELNQNALNLFYGFVDVQNRYVRFVGKPNQNIMDWAGRPQVEDPICLQEYLDILLDAQQAQVVDQPEDADVILTMGKGLEDNSLSLVDHNFFLEC